MVLPFFNIIPAYQVYDNYMSVLSKVVSIAIPCVIIKKSSKGLSWKIMGMYLIQRTQWNEFQFITNIKLYPNLFPIYVFLLRMTTDHS